MPLTPSEAIIRYGLQEDNPQILLNWLEGAFNTCQNNNDRWDVALKQYQLLLETISDELVAPHWRQWCLDNINRPLYRLNLLSSNAYEASYVNHLFHQLAVICQYQNNH